MVNWGLRSNMQRNFHSRSTVAVLLFIPIFNLESLSPLLLLTFLLLRSLGTHDCFPHSRGHSSVLGWHFLASLQPRVSLMLLRVLILASNVASIFWLGSLLVLVLNTCSFCGLLTCLLHPHPLCLPVGEPTVMFLALLSKVPLEHLLE